MGEAKNLNRNVMTMWKSDKLKLQDKGDTIRRFFVRIAGNAEAMKTYIESIFGPVRLVVLPDAEEEFGFLTGRMTERTYEECAAKFPNIIHMIRMQEQTAAE